jgi:putative phage-type endonuclease
MPLTPEQHAARRLSIGGSDIGVIAGVSPHKSSLKLYMEKLGLDEEAADVEVPTDNQLWGELLEEPIAKFYGQRHEVAVLSFAETLTHPDYDFLTANPDRAVVELERLLEIKTTSLGGIAFWRDPETGSLRPPQHVVLQINWYLGFVGWREADIVLLQFCESYFHPDRYVEFPLEFDAELFELELRLAINFWENHVLCQEPPVVDDAGDVEDYLKASYKRHDLVMLPATQEDNEAAARLAYATKQANHWTEQRKIEANALKARIGDNAGIRGEDWTYTWKTTKSSGVNWKALAESKNPTPEELKQFTRPCYRRQYFKFRGEAVE